jgi:uncharacterized protein YegP (UPF0339 family)
MATNLTYEVYSRRNWKFQKRWFWRLVSKGNGEIIAQGETNGYVNKKDCLHGITLVKASMQASVDEFA